ncbi:hypothetical protein [Rhizobium leguminosarum]|nr:hypothetical protein [Rhizobium leguminosarum]
MQIAEKKVGYIATAAGGQIAFDREPVTADGFAAIPVIGSTMSLIF